MAGIKKLKNLMSNKTILIRSDSSFDIGTGHIMRDLVLAKNFKHRKVIFATQNLQGNINEKILQNGFELKILKSDKLKNFIKLIKKIKPKLVIIDNYAISHKDEKKIKKQTKTMLMALDDTYKKHHCDILLNHNIYAKKSAYKNKVPKHCKIKCGKKQTLLRDEFKNQKSNTYEKNGLLVALGGSDSKNLSQKILKKLPSHLKINLVTSSANQNLKKLKKYVKNHKNITLHINTNQMALLMKKAKYGIITPSVLANEALLMELNFLAIKTAKNQALMYKYLKNKGFECIKNIKKFEFKKIEKYL